MQFLRSTPNIIKPNVIKLYIAILVILAIYKFRARFRIILCMKFDIFNVAFVIFKSIFFVECCRCLFMGALCVSILVSLMPLFLFLEEKLNTSTVILFLYNAFAYIFGVEPPDQIKILFICPFFHRYFFIHSHTLNYILQFNSFINSD